MKKKVLVKGPILSQSGYGEHARFVVRSLRKYEDHFDILLMTIPWGKTSWLWENNEERKWLDATLIKSVQYLRSGGKVDYFVHVTIPNEFEQAAPVNIGVTAGIETDRVAPIWIQKCESMQKIIVPSEHGKFGLVNTTVKVEDTQTGKVMDGYKLRAPVEVVHYPVGTISDKKLDIELKHDFNFLTISQWSPRKNLENTIKWFVEEFRNDKVGLVVKTSMANNSIIDRENTSRRMEAILSHYPDRECSVHLLHGYLTEEELSGLFQHEKIKAYVSITHGECYGLGLKQAAYHGLPVITCNWGGQLDFLYAPNKKGKLRPHFNRVDYTVADILPNAIWPGVLERGSKWCYPEMGSYKKALRDTIKDYHIYSGLAKKLQQHVLEKFDKDLKYDRMVESIVGYLPVNVNTEELPKISLYASVFNALEHLEGYMEDVVNQTIFEDKIELVLVHPETSPEFTKEKEIIEKYVEKYPNNIVYKTYKRDPGLYPCWDKAVKLCTGEYIGNRNVDDRMAKNSIEMYAKELYTNEEAGLVYGDCLQTDKPNETFEKNSSNGRLYGNMPEFSPENQLLVNLPHHAPLYRKSLHDQYGGFGKEFKSAGDFNFWLKCVADGVQFKKVQGVYNLYYFNPKGVSTDPANFKWKREEEKKAFMRWEGRIRERAA